MRAKLAVVQPRTRVGDDEALNGKEAVRYIDDAARQGAQLVLFPETYPGPWTDKRRYDPLAIQARASGVYVVAGTSERAEGTADGFSIVCLLIGPDGGFIGPQADKTTFDQLVEMVLTDFRINGRRKPGPGRGRHQPPARVLRRVARH